MFITITKQVQHVQQIHQSPIIGTPQVGNVQGQQYYQQGTSAMPAYSTTPQLYQQNVSQPIYHGYTTTNTTSGHVDVLPNQAPQQIYATHTNPPGNNTVASSVGYIQPVQVQVSLPQAANVQNSISAAPVQTIQVLLLVIFCLYV